MQIFFALSTNFLADAVLGRKTHKSVIQVWETKMSKLGTIKRPELVCLAGTSSDQAIKG
jgi:hypothetical protein